MGLLLRIVGTPLYMGSAYVRSDIYRSGSLVKNVHVGTSIYIQCRGTPQNLNIIIYAFFYVLAMI